MRFRQSYKSISILVLMVVVLAACKTTHAVPKGYYSYNSNKVQTAVEQLHFQPELPGFIPFHMVSVVSDVYSKDEKEVMDLSFYTKANDLLSITFVEGETSTEWIEPETVQISDQIEGTYEDNRFSKKLSWKKDGITYTLAYRASVDSNPSNERSVTREHLIEVARSFHL